MSKLTSVAFLIEPCEYALIQLQQQGKKPIHAYVMCCFEDVDGNTEQVQAALAEHHDKLRSLGWTNGPTPLDVTARMSGILTEEVGFQVMCVPMEDVEALFVPIEIEPEQ